MFSAWKRKPAVPLRADHSLPISEAVAATVSDVSASVSHTADAQQRHSEDIDTRKDKHKDSQEDQPPADHSGIWLNAYSDRVARFNSLPQCLVLANVNSNEDCSLVAADFGDFSGNSAKLITYNGAPPPPLSLVLAFSRS